MSFERLTSNAYDPGVENALTVKYSKKQNPMLTLFKRKVGSSGSARQPQDYRKTDNGMESNNFDS